MRLHLNHPMAEEFAAELDALSRRYVEKLTALEGEEQVLAQGKMLAVLVAAACSGCAQSGLRLNLALEMFRKGYLAVAAKDAS